MWIEIKTTNGTVHTDQFKTLSAFKKFMNADKPKMIETTSGTLNKHHVVSYTDKLNTGFTNHIKSKVFRELQKPIIDIIDSLKFDSPESVKDLIVYISPEFMQLLVKHRPMLISCVTHSFQRHIQFSSGYAISRIKVDHDLDVDWRINLEFVTIATSEDTQGK